MLRVDGSSRSSCLIDFIHRGWFLHRWWTMIDLCRLFIPWFGLRPKFQDHCDFVDSVRNWLFWLERAFMTCWYFEDSCWNLGHFSVGRLFIRLFKCSEYSLCVFLQFGFAPLRSLDCRVPMLIRWIVCGSDCLRLFSFITILYWIFGFRFCGLLGQVLAHPTAVLYYLLLIKTCPVFFSIYQWQTYSFIEK